MELFAKGKKKDMESISNHISVMVLFLGTDTCQITKMAWLVPGKCEVNLKPSVHVE
jgi:hypothetical protein